MKFLSSIRNQILTTMVIGIAFVVGFGGLVTLSFLKYQNINTQLAESYALQEIGDDLRDESYNEEKYANLKQRSEQLKPEFRKQAFDKVLLAYKERKSWLIPSRMRFFVKSEKQYRSHAQNLLPYLETRMSYYAIICLVAMLTSLICSLYLIQKKAFTPLFDLKNKMVDFLNNRYSYQFSVPAPNEVGQLHATFNTMAQRVIQNMEDLKALDRAKSNFLSIASHELRTPLTSIKGSLSLLNSGVVGKFEDPAVNLITIAEGESDRLIRLINDLLDLAKIESQKLPLECEWNSLNQLITVTAESLNGLCETADVKIDVPQLAPLEVFMDKDRIQQVLTNLLSNAIKYSPKGHEVHIQVTAIENESLKIEVRDEGQGIAPEDQELIFEQFRQATGPKNPLVKGTGLGLAIAKALVDEHGGEIGVTSVPEKGSTFYFTLPQWRVAQEIETCADESDMAA